LLWNWVSSTQIFNFSKNNWQNWTAQLSSTKTEMGKFFNIFIEHLDYQNCRGCYVTELNDIGLSCSFKNYSFKNLSNTCWSEGVRMSNGTVKIIVKIIYGLKFLKTNDPSVHSSIPLHFWGPPHSVV
jgi:hypothetical protein